MNNKISFYNEELKNHNAHIQIKALKNLLKFNVPSNAPVFVSINIQRIEKVLIFVEESLKLIDYDLSPHSYLESKLNDIINCCHHINSLDIPNQTLSENFFIVLNGELDKLLLIVNDIRTHQHTDNTVLFINDILKNQETARNNYKKLHASFINLSNKEEDTTTTINKLISESKEKLAQIILEIENDKEKIKYEATEKFESISLILNEQCSQQKEFIEKQKTELIELLGIVSDIAVSGYYKQMADTERKTGCVTRWISFSLMIICAVSIYIFFHQNEMTWQNKLIKILSTSIMFLPSAFLANESRQHYNKEKEYRKMNLELSSFDSFVRNLPSEEIQELKKNLVEKIFGAKEPVKISKKELSFIKPNKQLIDFLKEIVNKFLDK